MHSRESNVLVFVSEVSPENQMQCTCTLRDEILGLVDEFATKAGVLPQQYVLTMSGSLVIVVGPILGNVLRVTICHRGLLCVRLHVEGVADTFRDLELYSAVVDEDIPAWILTSCKKQLA